MANRTWIGGATPQVAQISKATITGYDASTTYGITVTAPNGATVAITVPGNTSVNQTATDLRAAFNTSTHPLAALITASGSAAEIILTSDTAGIPFEVASTAVSGTGTFGAFAITTPNVHPNDWNTAANWAEGAVPVAGDNVRVTGSQAISYGLRQAGVTLNNVYFDGTFSGTVGSASAPLSLTLGTGDRFEFAGRGLAYINLNASDVSPLIQRTANATAPNAGLYLSGTAIDSLTVSGGAVRIEDGSTLATAIVVGQTSALTIPTGVTITNLLNEGTATLRVAATSVECTAGVLTLEGEGAIGTLKVKGGVCYDNRTGSPGAVTTTYLDAGTLDTTGSANARTYTTLYARGGTAVLDLEVITITNPIIGTCPLRLELAA